MFKINDRIISMDQPPYIIAELSANHGGSIEAAKLAIDRAKLSGADAVKIQSYTPDTMTIESNMPDFQITDGLWSGYTLYDLYKEAHTPFAWHQELFDYARQQEITLFSTPFDETAVDLLKSLNAPAYKIASFEIIDLPLIKKVAMCGRPLLISTGMANFNEIKEAVQVALKYGCGDILLFHCISNYPTPVQESNLRNLTFLKSNFGVEVGLSDHSLSNVAAISSIALGATAIEKHFKPDASSTGPDASFSLNPTQFKSLVSDCHDAWHALGKNGFNRSVTEEASIKYRRSVYFTSDLNSGDKISSNDIRIIRPGFGLAPKFYDGLIGKTVTRDVVRGQPVSLNCIEE